MSLIFLGENIHARYRTCKVLHDITFSIKKGERILIVGPNGCGKSTLLKVLAGMLIPEKGRFFFKGKDISHSLGHERIRLGIGYLMQTHNIFPTLTVEDNLSLAFWRADKNFFTYLEQIFEIFPFLKGKLHFRAGHLSGGERQALAISMVMMHPVDILLLDEPTAGLSPMASTSILEAVQKAQQIAKFATVIVEHNLKVVTDWVSRAVVMNQGRILAEDFEPQTLISPEKLQGYYFI